MKKFYKQEEITVNENSLHKWLTWDFPGGPVVKNPTATAGDMDSLPELPGPGRFHMPRGN